MNMVVRCTEDNNAKAICGSKYEPVAPSVQNNHNISYKADFLLPFTCSYYLEDRESHLRNCVPVKFEAIFASCPTFEEAKQKVDLPKVYFLLVNSKATLSPSSFPLRHGFVRRLPLEHLPVEYLLLRHLPPPAPPNRISEQQR